MHEDLAAAVDDLFPSVRADLEALVHIPSVSAPGYDSAQVRRSAEATADLMRRAGLDNVQLLEHEGAHPAVFGEIEGPGGAPTVLLYAHHDVQPPGPAGEWSAAPFEPVELDGRLFGRGSSDDKAGIVVHLGAIQAIGHNPPVGIKMLIEGEEEIGSHHLDQFLETYEELLASDIIVIADTENIETGRPSLTTSLRGLVDCEVELRTLGGAVHSGTAGGAAPDALISLSRLLASLHDDLGSVAVEGLVHREADELMPDAWWRSSVGIHDDVQFNVGRTVESRVWMQPSISVLAIDAPRVAEAINQLVPVARAKVSLRIPPGEDPNRAMAALVAHLETNAPWGAQVTVTPGTTGEAFELDTSGPAFDAFRDAFSVAWGADTAFIGCGGSIPFVAAFAGRFPEASIILTGVADHRSNTHAPDESVDLDDLRKATLAEAVALRLLAG